jgi:hypothetical protein
MMSQADEQEPAPPAPTSKRRGGMAGWKIAVISAGVGGAVLGGMAAGGVFSGKESNPSPSKP